MSDVDRSDPKAVLHHYLRMGRQAVRWKLAGLATLDQRRPLVPTGTNLLGLVKHLASVEAGYLGDVFGRPFPEELPWFAPDAAPNADMWATADERTADVLAFADRVAAHADATIAALPIDAPGRVPWWGEDGDVTLQLVLVHLVAEYHRHAGHADVVRELVDGAVGHREEVSNLPDLDTDAWRSHREQVEAAARLAAQREDVSAK